jgi:DNA-directed RNA polymerase subunit RPC12/RpoP
MRKFQCYDCGHTWELLYGEGGRGTDLACPKCGGKNLHRFAKERGRGWRSGKRDNDGAANKGQGWDRGLKNRRGPQDAG